MLLPWRRRAASTAREARTSEQSLRLRRIFDDCHSIAWRVLHRCGVPDHRLEDCFQQVFLVIAERLADIQEGRERAFVYGVAIRVARGHQRNRAREVVEDDADQRAAIEPLADALLDRRRLVEVCDRILEGLALELREVFVLHEIEGLSGSELSALLGIPEGTVHSRLRRARIRVREAVEAMAAASSAAEGHHG